MPSFLKNKNTFAVAKSLIGSLLCRKLNGQIIKLPITEIEVYDGPLDLASHARHGKTKRNASMFEAGGIWYVYFVYGNHYMLNIVTGPKDYPAAILIRGAGKIKGPGRLTKFLQIDRRWTGIKAEKKTGLWIEKRKSVPKYKITPRIGVDYSGPIWSKKLYRLIAHSI